MDARGATVNYTYDNRGLTTQVSTTSPNTATIPVTPTVTMAYDNLGNRIQMTDGLGTQTYEYNQLSQLMAETRSFNDSLPNAPMANNSFKLQYSYSISGQLKSITDAYGQQINYTQDKIGRLNSISSSTVFGTVTNYVNNPSYRAWGALKSMTNGDSNSVVSLTYNNRLQTASYLLSRSGSNYAKKEYTYLATGDLSFNDDKVSVGTNWSDIFDRSAKYDHVGRVVQTRTGAESTGGTDTAERIPYAENFTHDAFGHTTVITGKIWGDLNDVLYVPGYVNNRPVWGGFDAEGNEVSSQIQSNVFDSKGQRIFSQGLTVENSQFLDGTGVELKRVRRIREDETQAWSAPNIKCSDKVY